MHNYQPKLVHGVTNFDADESHAALAVYTNGQPKPMLQVHLSGEALGRMGHPDMVSIESGHNSDREWIEVIPDNGLSRNWRKVTCNETATLPQYVRIPAEQLEIVPIEKTLTYCSGQYIGQQGVRVYLPRGFRLANNNDKPVTDGDFIASLKNLVRDARARGITIEASDDGGLQIRRTTVESI